MKRGGRSASLLHFVIYIFGAVLILTGLKFLRDTAHAPSLETNWLVRIARRFLGITDAYEAPRFFVRRGRARLMTPLFLVLLLVEATDLVFAVDSIPAIYAITDDPFIVFSSNVFAILGPRAMYFVLSGYLAGFVYLKHSLSAILVFVGIKILLTEIHRVHPGLSHGVILATGIGASLLVRRRAAVRAAPTGAAS